MRRTDYRWLFLVALVLGVATSVSAEPGPSEVRVGLPDRDWHLALEPIGVKYRPPTVDSSADRASVRGHDLRYGLAVEVEVRGERTPPLDGAECRDRGWNELLRVPYPMTRVQFRDQGDMAVAEYVILGHGQVRHSSRHVHAYAARDGACVEVHVYQRPQKLIQRHLLDRVLESVRLEEASGPYAQVR